MARMTAKKMFEELGYEQGKCDAYIWYYKKEEDNGILYRYSILFKNKWFSADQNSTDHYEDGGMLIDIPTFKAIHKQLEELGWLDD